MPSHFVPRKPAPFVERLEKVFYGLVFRARSHPEDRSHWRGFSCPAPRRAPEVERFAEPRAEG